MIGGLAGVRTEVIGGSDIETDPVLRRLATVGGVHHSLVVSRDGFALFPPQYRGFGVTAASLTRQSNLRNIEQLMTKFMNDLTRSLINTSLLFSDSK
ncbi:hypothetical protein TNCV_3494211 [Trichonephila clavipes]|nr:hypothetical protein TNCV_3494211 [Trichonephila clavipes]